MAVFATSLPDLPIRSQQTWLSVFWDVSQGFESYVVIGIFLFGLGAFLASCMGAVQVTVLSAVSW